MYVMMHPFGTGFSNSYSPRKATHTNRTTRATILHFDLKPPISQRKQDQNPAERIAIKTKLPAEGQKPDLLQTCVRSTKFELHLDENVTRSPSRGDLHPGSNYELTGSGGEEESPKGSRKMRRRSRGRGRELFGLMTLLQRWEHLLRAYWRTGVAGSILTAEQIRIYVHWVNKWVNVYQVPNFI